MLRFDDFIVDKTQARLLYQGTELAVDPKAFELLIVFTAQPNVIISREYLLAHLWAGVIVTDNAINKLIANLRKVLNDDPKNPRFIQTVPKRGYRFICDVSVDEDPLHAHTCSREKNTSSISAKPKWYANTVIGVLLFLFVAVGVFVALQWFLASTHDNLLNTQPYTLKLTNAQGAEKSPRMHPNNTQLYFLKKRASDETYQLWVKDISTSKQQHIKTEGAVISQIIALVTERNNETSLFYIDETSHRCGVYQARLTQTLAIEKQASEGIKLVNAILLFDCSNMRIKDIDYHTGKQTIYYTAQPKNFMPSQIFVFDLQSRTHVLVPQNSPTGWGHHNIDISPDGKKLLIMSNNSDYKTQLLILDLQSHEIIQGKKFDYVVTEAIWYHDSQQILYYAPPPSNQILISNIDGGQMRAFANVADTLSSSMSLFPDDKNIVFSTQRKNLRLRWQFASNHVDDIDNTIAYDTKPALFHKSQRYLFVSDRSGKAQLYMGRYNSNQANIVTNFPRSNALSYIAISADDKHVLLSMENEVYNIPANEFDGDQPLNALQPAQLIYASEYPIIWIDWLSAQHAAITFVKQGVPELKVVNVLNNTSGITLNAEGNWSYGMSDVLNPDVVYLVEQHTNRLFRGNVSSLFTSSTEQNLANNHSTHSSLVNTQIVLPAEFYHVKVDANTLFFCSTENNAEYLHAVPIQLKTQREQYALHDFDGYDIKNGNIMISDLEGLEGDVHRTMH